MGLGVGFGAGFTGIGFGDPVGRSFVQSRGDMSNVVCDVVSCVDGLMKLCGAGLLCWDAGIKYGSQEPGFMLTFTMCL